MIYKAIIIGSGPAGYTAAIRLAQLGHKVAIAEKDLVGGICINWGCTPSKAMIASAKVANTVRKAKHYGVETGEFKVNFSRVAARRDEVITRSREEIEHLFKHYGIDVLRGEAKIVEPGVIEVNGETYKSEKTILASGSQPLVPPFLQKQDPTIVNSNRLISIKELPDELTIVGGGIIGLEFATMFAHFGTKVRIIEFLDRCLATFDPEVSQAITEELTQIGVEVLTSHKVTDITNGVVTVEDMKTNQIKEIKSPLNLIAIGRAPVFNTEELQRLGINHDAKKIEVTTQMQTTNPAIYAVGDASGQSILAHVAVQQGIIAAEHIAGNSREMDYDVIPAVVYTLPEVASVGKVPADLTDVKVVSYPFAANLRANIEEHNKGFVKLWINTKNNQLITAQLIGDYAGEIIQGYATIIANKLDIETVANTIHAHPTYNEIVRNSLEYALGRAIEFIGTN